MIPIHFHFHRARASDIGQAKRQKVVDDKSLIAAQEAPIRKLVTNELKDRGERLWYVNSIELMAIRMDGG